MAPWYLTLKLFRYLLCKNMDGQHFRELMQEYSKEIVEDGSGKNLLKHSEKEALAPTAWFSYHSVNYWVTPKTFFYFLTYILPKVIYFSNSNYFFPKKCKIDVFINVFITHLSKTASQKLLLEFASTIIPTVFFETFWRIIRTILYINVCYFTTFSIFIRNYSQRL